MKVKSKKWERYAVIGVAHLDFFFLRPLGLACLLFGSLVAGLGVAYEFYRLEKET